MFSLPATLPTTTHKFSSLSLSSFSTFPFISPFSNPEWLFSANSTGYGLRGPFFSDVFFHSTSRVIFFFFEPSLHHVTRLTYAFGNRAVLLWVAVSFGSMATYERDPPPNPVLLVSPPFPTLNDSNPFPCIAPSSFFGPFGCGRLGRRSRRTIPFLRLLFS